MAAPEQTELSDESIACQAEAALDYSARGGDLERWLGSKAFLPGDETRIRERIELLTRERTA